MTDIQLPDVHRLGDLSEAEWRLHIWNLVSAGVNEARKTNGRVTLLEAWRNRITGAMLVMTVGIPVLAAAVSVAVRLA